MTTHSLKLKNTGRSGRALSKKAIKEFAESSMLAIERASPVKKLKQASIVIGHEIKRSRTVRAVAASANAVQNAPITQATGLAFHRFVLDIHRIQQRLQRILRKKTWPLRKKIAVYTAVLARHDAIIKKYLVRALVWVLVVDAVFFIFALKNILAPFSQSEQASLSAYLYPILPTAHASAQPIAVDEKTQALITALKSEQITGIPIAVTQKKEVSVPGILMTADKDTFSVFEYPDENTAQKEAHILSKKYSAEEGRSQWIARTHIYLSGTLVIFYLGTRDTLTTALSHVMSEPSTVS